MDNWVYMVLCALDGSYRDTDRDMNKETKLSLTSILIAFFLLKIYETYQLLEISLSGIRVLK